MKPGLRPGSVAYLFKEIGPYAEKGKEIEAQTIDGPERIPSHRRR